MKRVWLIFISFTLLFVIVSSVTTKVLYDRSFPRFDRQDESISAALRYSDVEENYARELLNFTSNGNTLQGYYYPQEDATALIVVSHGLGGGADIYLPYILEFLDAGFAVFSYDATGSFDSEGKTTRGFPQSLIDLESALTYISNSETMKDFDLLLFGHSWGGYASANALHLDFPIKAVISVAAPYSANAIIYEQTKRMIGGFALTQKPFLAVYQQLLFGEYATLDAIKAINESSAHVMIIQGSKDRVIETDGSAIYSQKDSITNANTVFILRSTEGQDDHNNLMRSRDAIDYIENINIEYRALYDSHNQAIPYDINQAFYASIDRFLMQSLDETLIADMIDFYLNALTS